MTQLNKWQLAFAKHYGDGDYAHVTTLEECRNVGDTIFTGVMIELDEKEGCDSADEADRRYDRIVEGLNEAYRLMEKDRVFED